MTYTPGINGGRINATISGNTAGAGALMSTGTITLAGGNNITLSQAGNAITISGPNSPSAASQTLGMSNIGNTAGDNAVISGSALRYVLAGGNNITLSQSTNASSATLTVSAPDYAYSGANGSATFKTLSVANSNGVSFSTGTQGLYASVNTSYRASNDAIGLNTAQSNVTWTANSAGLSLDARGYAGTGTTFNGANISGSITQNSAGINLSLSGLAALTSQSNQAVSGANGSFTFQTLSLANSNGVSFSTGTQGLYASHNGLTTAAQSNQVVNSINGSTGQLSFATGSSLSSSSNGSTITFGLASNITTALQSAGAYLTTAAQSSASNVSGVIAGTASNAATNQSAQLSGAVSFSNGSGVSFFTTVNGAVSGIAASVATNYLTTAMQSNASTQFVQANAAFNGTNASGTIASNGISVSVDAGGAADGYNSAQFTNSTANSTMPVLWAGNSNGSGNITMGLTGSTVTASHNGLTSQSNQAVSGANGSFAFQTLSLADSNGVSWSTGTQGLYATVKTDYQTAGAYLTTARASNDAIGLNTAKTNATWTVNSNGISFDGSGYAGTGTSATNASITMNSNGLAISVAAPGGGGGVALYDGANSISSGTARFSNSNGITFGVNGQTITASHNGLTTAAQSDHSHGNPTLALTNLSGTTASASNGLTLSLSAADPSGGAAVSTYIPYDLRQGSSASQTFGAMGATTGSAVFIPVSISNSVHFNAIRVNHHFSYATSNASGAQTISSYWGLYSNNASTLSSISTGSFSMALTNSSVSATLSYPASTGTAGYSFATTSASTTAQIHSLFGTAAGGRQVDHVFSNSISITPGIYWLGLLQRRSTVGANLGISAAINGNIVNVDGQLGRIGVISSASTTNFTMRTPIWQGFGPYTSTGSAGYGGTTLPGSVFMSGIAHTASIYPRMTFIST